MIKKTAHFELSELVCQHVYEKYGSFAWNFLDTRLLILLDTIRDRIGKGIFVNSWEIGGKFSQRGLRCPQCDIVKSKTTLYMSGHCLGKAVDFEAEGLLADETRTWLKLHENWWPYPFRLESSVLWVHMDIYNDSDKKIIEFTA